jgi:hypothetical protein
VLEKSTLQQRKPDKKQAPTRSGGGFTKITTNYSASELLADEKSNPEDPRTSMRNNGRRHIADWDRCLID